MTLGSLFSGSGGFELAGLLNGIEPRWNAEIEPFPCAVTAKRFPGIPNHGDVTKISGSEIEPVDIISFGSPCQDLSVAGLRKGIHEGQRSNLFFEAIRIIKEMREATNGKYPRFAVWENVPGAFSSNGGSDFRAVLEALCQVKDPGVSVPGSDGNHWKHAGCIVGAGYSIAWRVYDAQFWGVPQRRARIYLIADFGSERAGEILFESESLPGNPAESGEPRQGATTDSEGSAGAAGCICLNGRGGERMDVSEDISGTLRAQDHGHPPVVMAAGFCTEPSAKTRSIGYEDETSPTLRAGVVPAAIVLEQESLKHLSLPITKAQEPEVEENGSSFVFPPQTTGCLNAHLCRGFNGQDAMNELLVVKESIPSVARTLTARHDSSPCIDRGQNVVCYGICSYASNSMKSSNPNSGIYEAETARTLDTSGGNPACNQGGY